MTTTHDHPAIRQAVAHAWAAATIVTHTPTENTYGMTCDEQGCIACNAGTDAIDWITADLADPRWDPNEAADALEALADWLRGTA